MLIGAGIGIGGDTKFNRKALEKALEGDDTRYNEAAELLRFRLRRFIEGSVSFEVHKSKSQISAEAIYACNDAPKASELINSFRGLPVVILEGISSFVFDDIDTVVLRSVTISNPSRGESLVLKNPNHYLA